ncbi:hypothetical protein PUR29_14050 [Methylobacterium ajmalii]|uniref:Uncharacterized protein n=1 Tax=Methylobacterium ajmalii TaxID=2738439 RepID=A0ABU9ZU82_9HYPH
MAAFFVIAVVGAFFAGVLGSEGAIRDGEMSLDSFDDDLITNAAAAALVVMIVGIAGFVACHVMGWRA